MGLRQGSVYVSSTVSLVGGWLLTPVLLLVLVAGHGLLVERICRIRLPGPLLPGVGLATLIVVTGILTIGGGTAPAAAPVAAVLAVIGIVWGRAWGRIRRRGAVVAAAVAVATFALFAAPSLLTSQGSVAGYLKLDDSATWLAITGHVMEHGRDLDGLAPSSHRRTLEAWVGSGYPTGAFLPLGVSAKLARQDPAAAYQSVIAVYAAILALGVTACFAPLVRTRGRAALVGVAAVQASTFYGYAQWGGGKEAASAALLPPLGFLAARSSGAAGGRTFTATMIVAGGVVGVLGINGATWAGPALVVAAGGVLYGRLRARATSSDAAPAADGGGLSTFAVPGTALVVASLPALVTISFLRHTTDGGAVSRQSEVANLVRPLSLLQAGGLWPTADFRFVGPHRTLVVWVAFVCLLSAFLGAVLAVVRREAVAPTFAFIAGAGAVPALAIGSPWVDAKVMAIVSPVVLGLAVAFALVVCAAPERSSRLAGGGLLAILIAASGLSTLAVAREAYVAPRQRFSELRQLGTLLRGEGPTVVLDFDVYASRYFLREADAEGATDLRYRRVRRRDGSVFPERSVADVDLVAVPDLWEYRTVVRRRSPSTSRPPTGFTLVHAGQGWEAWQRSPDALPPLARLPLGVAADPGSVPACEAVEAIAATPGANRLRAVRSTRPVIVPVDAAAAPRSWITPRGVTPSSDGSTSTTVSVPASGEYRVWVGGAVLGRLEVRVDGRVAGTAVHQLAHAGQWLRFGVLQLEEGPHRVELRYSRLLRSGVGFPAPLLGPIALAPDPVGEVVELPPTRFRELCDGSRYDWIEAVAAEATPP